MKLRTRYSAEKKAAFSLIEISVVILIIGILIAAVATANILIKKSRISTAQALTISSPINGIKDSALWLESGLNTSFQDSESSDKSPINSWYDNRSSANKVLVSAVGTGPVYSNSINSIHAVKFEGSSVNYLKIPDASFLNNTDYTIFVLENRLSASGDNYFIGNNSSASEQKLILGYSLDQQVIHSQASGAVAYNANIVSYASSSKPRIFSFVSDSSSGKKIYINGVLAAQNSDISTLSGVTELVIGKGYSGEIGEIAIFTRALKGEERRSIEDYIGKKWSSKINRDSAPSGSCVGYTVTDSGCDLSSASCSISKLGVITTSVSATSTPTSLTCNVAHFSGSVSYTCVNGISNITGNCSCATGYSSSDPNCNTCDTGYEMISGNCQAISCNALGTGIAPSTTVTQATGTITCTAGYSGTLTYSCSAGSFAITSGTCAVSSVVCTGGTIDTSTVPGETIHTFQSSGTFTCSTPTNVRVLVVAGGGGGSGGAASAGGSGGGAGGLIYNASFAVSTTPITVTVGAGGAGGPNTYNVTGNSGVNGQNSQFSTLIASGGGGAGGRNDTAVEGNSGGSGGGAGISGTSKLGGAGTSDQGFAGGNNFSGGGNYGGGGGGGAGGAGQNGVVNKGGNGGVGIQNNISGSPSYYGGGGGASYFNAGGTNGTGGLGGGGNVGSAGAPNTGGGGGGSITNTGIGNSGGSGIVIVRY